MPFIPLPQGVQLCFDFTTAGQQWQFCLHFKKNVGNPTLTDLQTMANAGAAWWSSDLDGNMPSVTTLRQVRATDMTSQGAPAYTATVNLPGGSGEESAPLNAAVVISHRTGKRGRSYRGRSYVSSIPLTQLATGTAIEAAHAAALASAFGTLIDDIEGPGFEHVVYSKQHNGVVSNPATSEVVTNLVTDINIDSQRRRLFGRGT